jgi:hypothetical protein
LIITAPLFLVGVGSVRCEYRIVDRRTGGLVDRLEVLDRIRWRGAPHALALGISQGAQRASRETRGGEGLRIGGESQVHGGVQAPRIHGVRLFLASRSRA